MGAVGRVGNRYKYKGLFGGVMRGFVNVNNSLFISQLSQKFLYLYFFVGDASGGQDADA